MDAVTLELETCLVDRQLRPRGGRTSGRVTQQVGGWAWVRVPCQASGLCPFYYQAALNLRAGVQVAFEMSFKASLGW